MRCMAMLGLAQACTTALTIGRGNHAASPVACSALAVACSALAVALVAEVGTSATCGTCPCTGVHRYSVYSVSILQCPCRRFFQLTADTAWCTRGSLLALPGPRILGICAGCVAHRRTPLPCGPMHTHLSTLFLTLPAHLGRPAPHGATLCPAWLEPSRALA